MKKHTHWPLLLLAALTAAGAVARDPTPIEQAYPDTAARIIQAAMKDEGAWRKLGYLCDRIGNRVSGSPQLDEAIRWAADEMKRDGLSNVHLLPTHVAHWVRGRESARIVTPRNLALHMTGLGGSVGTPPEGVRAPVVVVSNFDELAARGRAEVEGKIVVYNEPWEGYGRTVAYRTDGAVESRRTRSCRRTGAIGNPREPPVSSHGRDALPRRHP